MDSYTIKIAAEYGSLGLYIAGLLGFLVFALFGLRKSFKHFIITTVVGVVWPVFLAIILLRQNKHDSRG